MEDTSLYNDSLFITGQFGNRNILLNDVEPELSKSFAEDGTADSVKVAREFVDRRFSNCAAALLFGSAARMNSTGRSDLDILIIESRRVLPYHQHFQEKGLCFDIMGRSLRFCTKRLLGRNQRWGHLDDDQILLIACADGIELKDDRSVIPDLKQSARSIFDKGPVALTAREISDYRLLITEALDDFVDCEHHAEAGFLAHSLVIVTAQFLMGYKRQWSARDSKWIHRRLRCDNDPLARQLLDGLVHYRGADDRKQFSRSIESILNLVGGRLYRDDLGGHANRAQTRLDQFLERPMYLTRKAIRRVLGDPS